MTLFHRKKQVSGGLADSFGQFISSSVEPLKAAATFDVDVAKITGILADVMGQLKEVILLLFSSG